MSSLDKYSGNCDVLSPKKCNPKNTTDTNFKVFNMITKKKKKAKQWQNVFHTTANSNSIVQLAIQIENGITKHAYVSVKTEC